MSMEATGFKSLFNHSQPYRIVNYMGTTLSRWSWVYPVAMVVPSAMVSHLKRNAFWDALGWGSWLRHSCNKQLCDGSGISSKYSYNWEPTENHQVRFSKQLALTERIHFGICKRQRDWYVGVSLRNKLSTRMNKSNKSDFMDTSTLATVRSLVGLGGDLIIHLELFRKVGYPQISHWFSQQFETISLDNYNLSNPRTCMSGTGHNAEMAAIPIDTTHTEHQKFMVCTKYERPYKTIIHRIICSSCEN